MGKKIIAFTFPTILIKLRKIYVYIYLSTYVNLIPLHIAIYNKHAGKCLMSREAVIGNPYLSVEKLRVEIIRLLNKKIQGCC